MGVIEKSYETRYLTYWLIFPSNTLKGDFWVRQIPFIHDLQFEMQNWKGINKDPNVMNKLLKKGEAHWKDHNGVEHRLVIEDKKRPEKWGIQRQ